MLSSISTNEPKFINKQYQPAFKNAPIPIDYLAEGVPKVGEITAKQAKKIFKKLEYGSYLDIGNDSFDFARCNKIRQENLNFLNRIESLFSKFSFLLHYEEVTGFPDLQEVSNRIVNTFVNTVKKSSASLKSKAFDIVQAGFDGVCSVGRGKAFPGSDLDKAYVILKGSQYSHEDREIVNRFKASLWFNTDQRLLSYNHDEAAFPQVYTLNQVLSIVNDIEKQYLVKHNNSKDLNGVSEQERIIGKYNADYIKANPYYIELCQKYRKNGSDDLFVYNISRENVKNLGFVLESMREGKHLIGDRCSEAINYTEVYKLANLSQLNALKQHGDRKPKRLARNNIANDYRSWDIDKRLRFVKALIESSCGNNKVFSVEFADYFSKPGQDLFEPLIKAMMD